MIKHTKRKKSKSRRGRIRKGIVRLGLSICLLVPMLLLAVLVKSMLAKEVSHVVTSEVMEPSSPKVEYHKGWKDFAKEYQKHCLCLKTQRSFHKSLWMRC